MILTVDIILVTFISLDNIFVTPEVCGSGQTTNQTWLLFITAPLLALPVFIKFRFVSSSSALYRAKRLRYAIILCHPAHF